MKYLESLTVVIKFVVKTWSIGGSVPLFLVNHDYVPELYLDQKLFSMKDENLTTFISCLHQRGRGNVRTITVTAAILWGFGHRLPCYQVTNFLDLSALGRHQPLYTVLWLCRNLCFWQRVAWAWSLLAPLWGAPLLPKIKSLFSKSLERVVLCPYVWNCSWGSSSFLVVFGALAFTFVFVTLGLKLGFCSVSELGSCEIDWIQVMQSWN